MPGRLALHAAGLVVLYSAYGLLQERIVRGSYGPLNERFHSTALLVLANRVIAILPALAILHFKSEGSFWSKVRPKSAVKAYALVAGSNFLATTCQYEALKHVSYTTQSLAKCVKMCPVIIVGFLVYKKTYNRREWIASLVVIAGAAMYLFSAPPLTSKKHASLTPGQGNAFAGAFLLASYLFCDGMTSTTQEKMFGGRSAGGDPFGQNSQVLDQMIWVNACSSLIAAASLVIPFATGSLQNDLSLLAHTPRLVFDVLALSATAAFGLLVLLNSVASFGALTTSTIMTFRQFLSILINAGTFNNFGTVAPQGWIGVGWVASGIWIKMNKKYEERPPKAAPVHVRTSSGESSTTLFDSSKNSPRASEEDKEFEKEHLVSRRDFEESVRDLPEDIPPVRPRPSAKKVFMQYILPLLIPVAIVILMAPLMGSDWSEHVKAALRPVHRRLRPLYHKVTIDGGHYDAEIHRLVSPLCDDKLTTEPFPGNIRTGFASFPRSGNSYLRGLVERTTGYRTTSVYCDLSLEHKFVGECDAVHPFFQKTHFPGLYNEVIPGVEPDAEYLAYHEQFDQVVYLVRNPLDAIASLWHMENKGLKANGEIDHEGKLAGVKFGAQHRVAMLVHAFRWMAHAEYWHRVPALVHAMRYEDIRSDPIPQMMGLSSFLLKEEATTKNLPSLEKLACMVERIEALEAYKSRKVQPFDSWDSWEPTLRMDVLQHVKKWFCTLGYDQLLYQTRGPVSEVEKMCDSVKLDPSFKYDFEYVI